MSDIFNAFLNGLCSSRRKIEVEVFLPYDLTAMDMYQIFKNAAAEVGAELTGFEVKEDNA